MAELLVRARKHYMDDWDSTKVSSLTTQEKTSYDARSQIGDIIVVRDNGWTWGKSECLPEYVVVKVPDLSLADAKVLKSPLIDDTDKEKPKMLKVRRYYIKQKTITDAVDSKTSTITLSLDDYNNVLKGKNDKK